ncbi:MAG: hypothetical protein ACREBC_29385, partial [Pyrinomonadaceae bacterium]
MKPYVLAGLMFVLSFAAGIVVGSTSHVQKALSTQNKVPTARSTPAPTPCPEADQFPNLIDDAYVTKFNGARIDLNNVAGVKEGDVPWAVASAEITPLRNGDLLVNVDNTLYRLDGQRRIVWSYQTTQLVIDYAYVDSTNLVYGTAGDNTMFILNATTGKVELFDSRNGSAAYGVTVNYGDDMCLVTDNFVRYREKFRDLKIEPTNDGITCWRGTKIL